MRSHFTILASKLVLLLGALIAAVSAEEVVLGLDKAEISSTFFSGLHPNITVEGIDPVSRGDFGVHIPGCNIKIEPKKFHNVPKKDWFNLAHPEILDPRFQAYGKAPDTVEAYGHEHIYEVQMISMFITSLQKTLPALWNPKSTPTADFCDWVKTYVTGKFDNNLPVIDKIKECLPYNGNKDETCGYMPMLDRYAGRMKASAIAGIPIRSEDTFKKYDKDVMVADIRTVGGVLSYMKDDKVKKAWVCQSQCIRTAWLTWLPEYAKVVETTTTSDAFGKLYDDWVDERQKNARQSLVKTFTDMVQWWHDERGEGTIGVYVNFNSLIDSANSKYQAPASTSILAALYKYMM